MAAVSPDKLLERLARGKPVAAVVLLGTDHYLREMCRDKMIQAYVPEGARDWAVARLSARDSGWDGIISQAQTLPMMARCQVIIVEDAESFEKLSEKSRDETLKMLGEYLDSPAPFTALVIEASALDGRQKFYKLLQEKALLVELSIDTNSAASLAMQMAKDLGTEIDREAATLLADILNGAAARIRIELEKLATYTQGRPRITSADVETLVVAARKNTVWQLGEMLANQNRTAALTFLDNLLREGEQPLGIVGALAWMYRKLIEARHLPAHTSGFQAARQLGMRPDAAETAIRQAHRIPKAQLLAGLVSLAEADNQLKSGNPDPRTMMEFLIAQLTLPDLRPVSRIS
jgi:DNA polymerase III subunit delta